MRRKLLLSITVAAITMTSIPTTAHATETVPENISRQVLQEYYKETFDAETYKQKNPDLAEQYGDNMESYLNHYIECGINEGRRTGNFDCVAFVWNNREYYREHGLEKGNPFFDAEKYRKNNHDLDAAYGDDMQAYVEHYITFGVKEGRSSESPFDIHSFSKDYPNTGVKSNASPEEVLNSYKSELAKNRICEEENTESMTATDTNEQDDTVVEFELDPVPVRPLYD